MNKSEAPDLVITEAMLPKLHGFELCSRISHSAVRKVPVVIVTGVYRDTVYKTEATHTFGAARAGPGVDAMLRTPRAGLGLKPGTMAGPSQPPPAPGPEPLPEPDPEP